MNPKIKRFLYFSNSETVINGAKLPNIFMLHYSHDNRNRAPNRFYNTAEATEKQNHTIFFHNFMLIFTQLHSTTWTRCVREKQKSRPTLFQTHLFIFTSSKLKFASLLSPSVFCRFLYGPPRPCFSRFAKTCIPTSSWGWEIPLPTRFHIWRWRRATAKSTQSERKQKIKLFCLHFIHVSFTRHDLRRVIKL